LSLPPELAPFINCATILNSPTIILHFSRNMDLTKQFRTAAWHVSKLKTVARVY
jgi:hypothetical protein